MMKRIARSWITGTTLGALALSGTVGCSSWTRAQKGAVIGAAGGAAAGAVVGKKTGSTARGAIIGAAVGGAAGAVIGHQMDQQAKELAYEIEGATVQRVGEGIVVTFESGLLFDFDSEALRPESQENLRKLAESLQKYPKTDLLIVGHTDAKGSDSYNLDLSQRRATSARRYLNFLGVTDGRLRTAGRGEAEPIDSNDSEAGRQQNRRIEVAIYANEEMRREAARAGGE